ncbi:MAG TPA: response regulator [Thermodesulfobacteriota bacterium]|nr:response regulator [Thermodesulfobacteriota bacterium]
MKPPLKILHLEDNPDDAELIRSMLMKEGIVCDVVRVENQRDFLTALEQGQIDLVLSDYSLPSLDGISALKMMRERYPDLPFIFVSGVIDEELAIETIKSGATDYVLKHRLSRLVSAVRRALSEVEERAERKRAEEKVRQMATLLDIATDAIIVQDMDHIMIFWNKSAGRLYGWTEEEVLGRRADEIYYRGGSSEFEEAVKITKEKGEWKGELHHVTKEGREVILQSRWTLVRDDEGKPKWILIVNTDITERKRMESQLLRAQRMESIGTLAGGIAHDLNNILQPIIMAIGILRQEYGDEKNRKLLDTIEASARRGANLVKQVLSFARGEEGEHTVLQMRHLIPEIEKIVKETFPKSIDIHTDTSRDLWTILGDPTQLHQVLMNLCVNARDAMPNGGTLTISAENLLIDENYAQTNIDARVGPYVVITVSDTGIGIPPEIIDRIFEPFFTTKGPDKGTGLGLSTTFGIVKGHGGFINVYSEVGKGTRFMVYLPAIETSQTKEARARREKGLPLGNGELILVVDDEASILEITRATLETYGYRVITASDGVEAIALYIENQKEIKAVILDMMMPIMDGAATIRALRRIDPGVKVIAVSGLKGNEGATMVSESEVKAFLSKPYTAESLLKTLHGILTMDRETS